MQLYRQGDRVIVGIPTQGDDLNDDLKATLVTFPAGSVGVIERVEADSIAVVLSNPAGQTIVQYLSPRDIQPVEKNVERQPGFKQVCVWPGTVVGTGQQQNFVDWMATEFDGIRVQYLEEIVTPPDASGPGGRNDLFFAVHDDDVTKFAGPRLAYSMRWLEDVIANQQHLLYPPRIIDYSTWCAQSPR